MRYRKGTLMSQGKTHMLPLTELHQALAPRFRSHHITLELINSTVSAANPNTPSPTLTYMRPLTEARAVERLMGREGDKIDVRRHPVIEIRPLGTGLAMEMILTPDAWFYQQNFIGKLSIERHLSAFHKLISGLSEDFRLGFWQGLYLDDMHLTPKFLNHRVVLENWMSTYCDGRDYFRVGVWSDTSIDPRDALTVIQQLHSVYEFIAWTGSNDFRAFYRGAYASV